MSLDTRIRDLAEKKLLLVLEQGQVVLDSLANEYGLETKDIARLLSMHKTKTTHTKVIKQLSSIVSERFESFLGAEVFINDNDKDRKY